jgi:hypothetical protein
MLTLSHRLAGRGGKGVSLKNRPGRFFEKEISQ